MPINRKAMKMRLADGRRFTYSMKDKSQISTATPQYFSFEVVVEYDKQKDHTYLFATNLRYKSETILRLYRERWGQETGYRMYYEFLIKTTSSKYVVRLFYFLFAYLMYNAWVLYNAQQTERKNEDEIIVMQMKTLLLFVILLDYLEAT